MPEAKLVAVIGSGVSGLTTIKSLKEEGCYVVCYEMTNSLGGVWNYRDETIEGVASLIKSTVTNTSKEIMTFSDFPPPREYPNYMSHRQVLNYLELYAKAHDLLRHIEFRQEVIRVLPTADNYRTGRWEVTVKDNVKNRTKVEVFDGVAVCVGRYGFPKMPSFHGMENFKGQILHTHELKRCEDFKDQKVLVVGSGNSGADAAVYLSAVAEQVYISSRNGSWIIQRRGTDSLPFDLKLTRVNYALLKLLPKRLAYWYLERQANKNLNHDIYCLRPNHRILTKRPTVNDYLGSGILTGTIIVKGAIKHVSEKGVIFQNESEVVNIDTIIVATGYQLKVPFLNDIIFQVIGDHVPLYKHVFPPHLTIPSLAIIGMTQNYGPALPVCEIQARWFALVVNNKVPFPDKGDVINDITKNSDKEAEFFHPSSRNCMQIHIIPYIDEIASLIGAKPNFSEMFLREPKLVWKCLTGPFLPYQYRLVGPHSWVGARNAIETYKERVLEPLRTRRESSRPTAVVS